MKQIILSLLTICLGFSTAIAQNNKPLLSYNDFRSSLRKEMDHKTVVETFGRPDKDIGSGIYVFLYTLSDSTTMLIGCTDRILYARHSDNNNNLLHILFDSPEAAMNSEKMEYTYPAILRPEINQKDAVINDQVMFTAKQGQLILYNGYAHTAWIADGRYGYIPPEDLIRVDTAYFRFDFSRTDFTLDAANELFIAAQRQGTDINQLTVRVMHKDKRALLELFLLRDSFDGAAAEIFPGHFWALLNLWSDSEIAGFVNKLDDKNKKPFTDYISDKFVTFPVEKPLAYYKLYYPETLELILKNK